MRRLFKQRSIEPQATAETLLPARHPLLRDTAVIVAIISTFFYFAFSEGVAGFLGFVSKIFARLVHATN